MVQPSFKFMTNPLTKVYATKNISFLMPKLCMKKHVEHYNIGVEFNANEEGVTGWYYAL